MTSSLDAFRQRAIQIVVLGERPCVVDQGRVGAQRVVTENARLQIAERTVTAHRQPFRAANLAFDLCIAE